MKICTYPIGIWPIRGWNLSSGLLCYFFIARSWFSFLFRQRQEFLHTNNNVSEHKKYNLLFLMNWPKGNTKYEFFEILFQKKMLSLYFTTSLNAIGVDCIHSQNFSCVVMKSMGQQHKQTTPTTTKPQNDKIFIIKLYSRNLNPILNHYCCWNLNQLVVDFFFSPFFFSSLLSRFCSLNLIFLRNL